MARETWDWTQVSRAIGEHPNRWANVPVIDVSYKNLIHRNINIIHLECARYAHADEWNNL